MLKQYKERVVQHSHCLLLKDVFSYGAIHGLLRLVPLITLPILTHLLSQQSIGQIEIILSIFSLLIACIFSFQSGYFRFYHSDMDTYGEKNMRHTFFKFYLGLGLAVVTLLFSILLLVFYLNLIKHSLFFATSYAILAVIPNILFRFALGHLRLTRNIKAFASLSLVDAILKASSILLFVWLLKMDLQGYFLGYFAAISVSVFLVYQGYYADVKLGKFNSEFLLNAVKFSLPLIPSVLISLTGQYLGRFVTAASLDWADVAVLAVSIKLALVAKFLTQAFNFAWQTISVKYINDPKGTSFYAKTLNYFVLTALITVFIVSLLAPWVLALIFPPEYHQSAIYVPFLVGATLLSSANAIVEMGARIAQKTTTILLSNLLGLLSNVAFLLFYLADLGILAIVYGALLHNMVRFLFQLYASQKNHMVAYRWQSIVGLSVVLPCVCQLLFFILAGKA